MNHSLLDTDTLSEVLKKKNANVVKHAVDYLSQFQQFTISAMTRYEVVRGLIVTSATRQMQDFDVFCQNAEILPVTDAILERSAELWAVAHRGGHPRFDADLIIAATALEHGPHAHHGQHAAFFVDSRAHHRKLARCVRT